jgi:predicted nucleotidyltransferase
LKSSQKTTAGALPGNSQHQALLQHIIDFYHDDPRILAVIVFGSLGRGNWDNRSDLDLDIILHDGEAIDAAVEIKSLCASFPGDLGHLALLIPNGVEEADAVLDTLAMLSIRYHPLATTKPAILDSMRVLSGSLDPAVIRLAGLANCQSQERPLEAILEEVVYYAAVSDVYVQRSNLWMCDEVFHRLRTLLMELYARTHSGGLALRTFTREAPDSLQTLLAKTLPQAAPGSLRDVQQVFVDILEKDLPALTANQLTLTEAQHTVVKKLRGNGHH